MIDRQPGRRQPEFGITSGVTRDQAQAVLRYGGERIVAELAG